MSNQLKGKRIVLLGGTAGIGFATAMAAAAEGANVLIASGNKERVSQALGKLPAGAEGSTLDLSKESAIRDFFSNMGDFDHLVYTAGEKLLVGELENTGIDAVKDFFAVRYFGAIAAVKYGSTKIRPGGSITLTMGVANRRPTKGWAAGASICGAVEGLTRALAMELAPIRVNAVSPGVVKTDLWSDMPETDREVFYQHVRGSLPVGRVGDPEDIAAAYLYLMKQQYCTGQVHIVDGGHILV